MEQDILISHNHKTEKEGEKKKIVFSGLMVGKKKGLKTYQLDKDDLQVRRL